jgi:hypothetical protein
MLRIDVILFGIGFQPAHCTLTVFNLSGKRHFALLGCRVRLRQTIGDRDRDIALLGRLLHHRFEVLSIPTAPATAMNQHQPRKRSVSFLWTSQIQLQLDIAPFAVHQILLNDDFRLAS